MSRDVERELRDVRGELPRPDEATMRAFEPRVLELATRRRRRNAGAGTARFLTIATAIAVAFLVGATSHATGLAAFADAPGDPTIAARKYKAGATWRIDLSGRIPSDKAGEPVEILERECGSEHFRIASGASTVAGGFWNGRLSDELVLRSAVFVNAFRIRGRQFTARVGTRLQSMARKTVVLQRRTHADTWVRVRTLRLRQDGFGSFRVDFRVPTRGLRLRVLVPQESARPCHDAAASPPFSS